MIFKYHTTSINATPKTITQSPSLNLSVIACQISLLLPGMLYYHIVILILRRNGHA